MNTSDRLPLEAVEDFMLRAWVEAGYLQLAEYIAEMERRRAARTDSFGHDRDGGGPE